MKGLSKYYTYKIQCYKTLLEVCITKSLEENFISLKIPRSCDKDLPLQMPHVQESVQEYNLVDYQDHKRCQTSSLLSNVGKSTNGRTKPIPPTFPTLNGLS